MKRIIVFAAVAFAALLAVSCGSGEFTDAEKAIINSTPDKILKVYKIDSEEELAVLRETSTDLSESELQGELYKVLAERMVRTVTHPDVDGVGLAAPQIGINRNIVAVQRFDKEGHPFEVYPNISIVEYSDSLASGPEGCLSVPDRRHDVERSTGVTIRYYSLEAGEMVEEKIEGFTAVIFQHEVDHLSGVLYIDHLPEFLTYAEETNFRKTPKFVQTMEFFRRLEEYSPMVNCTSFGTSPMGRDLALVIVDKDGLKSPEQIRAKGRVIILVESCIHAGEPDGKDASMIFLRDMIVGKKNMELLDDVSFLFVPVFNVDGHENFTALNRINQNGPDELGTRNTSQQLNLNRDFLKADAPEMKAWLKMYNYWLPELFIDVHVTNGADFQYVLTYAIDNMTGNMEPGITRWSRDVYEKQLCSMMAEAGFPVFWYGSFKKYNAPESGFVPDTFDPRYSQGYAAAHNRLGLLIETHIYKPYKQRVRATIEAIEASARILASHKGSLVETLAAADAYTSSEASRKEPFGFNYRSTEDEMVMMDYLSWGRDTVKSDLSGGEWVTHDYTDSITLNIPVYTSFAATSSVKLPKAYILMPQWKNVIELLDLHGIRYSVLQEAGEVEVETYRYKGGKFSSRQSEGRIPVTAEYTTQVEKLEYPAGSIYIDMNQPASRVAMWLLEPSAPGSLTYWGFFNVCVQAGNEFWIRPQYMEVKGREMLAADPALKARFEQKLREDASFASNPQAILDFFYQIVKKRSHQNNELHPAWRVL